jgi:hypothetical protein
MPPMMMTIKKRLKNARPNATSTASHEKELSVSTTFCFVKRNVAAMMQSPNKMPGRIPAKNNAAMDTLPAATA